MRILIILFLAISAKAKTVADFPNDFLFGLATAPGHVEDQLDDVWARQAEQGGIPGIENVPQGIDRLKFYTAPEIELDVAKSMGIDIYRTGIDWERLQPEKDGPLIDQEAWAGYRERMFKGIRERGMKTMLTLFHHSAPKWFIDSGGWTKKENSDAFVAFAKAAIDQVKEDGIEVDYWITINEPWVMSFNSHVSRLWPNYKGQNASKLAPVEAMILFRGDFRKSIDHMISAHKEVYKYLHEVYGDKVMVSISKNAPTFGTKNRFPRNAIQKRAASLTNKHINQYIIHKLHDSMDFVGVNYYGIEYLSLTGIGLRKDKEFMDSGRGLNPNGLYDRIMEYNKILESYGKKLPFFITENGISDSTDIIRPAYLIEHLMALHALMEEGITVLGYIFWTLSDNWEWSDGYCPAFGLFAVDRTDPELKRRIPREHSVNLFKEIMATHQISSQQRTEAWQKVEDNWGQPRPMCRDKDGQTALPEEDWEQRKYIRHDWRFKK